MSLIIKHLTDKSKEILVEHPSLKHIKKFTIDIHAKSMNHKQNVHNVAKINKKIENLINKSKDAEQDVKTKINDQIEMLNKKIPAPFQQTVKDLEKKTIKDKAFWVNVLNNVPENEHTSVLKKVGIDVIQHL